MPVPPVDPARNNRLGAGLVAGASANDPTTVATLAVIGASTVYGLSWLVILVIPMLMTVQTIAGHVGAVRHAGFAGVVRAKFGQRIAIAVIAAIAIVNVITLAADLEGAAAALSLLSGAAFQWFVAPLGLVAAYLLVSRGWITIERQLQFVPLVFLAYIGSTILAHPDWGRVLHQTLVPSFQLSRPYLAGAIALLGTTLTSYVYVWQMIAVAESRPQLHELPRIRTAATLGMVVSGVTFWFILIGTGATLGVNGVPVETAQDAASALAPLAGRWSEALFGLGLFGSALLSIPVIAATTAHLVAEAMGKPSNLNLPAREAPLLSGALIVTMLVATAVAYSGVPPIRLLFFGSIVGGVATPFTLALLVFLARDRETMKGHVVAAPLAVAGWIVTAVVAIAALAYLAGLR